MLNLERRGKPSYLPSTVGDKFIELMRQKIKTTIVRELQQAKYFSVIVDSPPDVVLVDQFTFIF